MNFFPQKSVLILAMSALMLGCGVDESGYVPPQKEEPKPEEPKPEEPKPEEPKPEEPKPEEPKPEEPKPEEPAVPLPRPPVPQLTAQACDVSFEKWKSVKENAEILGSIAAYGCNGMLTSIDEGLISSNGESKQKISYVWGKNLSKPTIINHYEEGKLKSTQYANDIETKTNCLPNDKIIKKLEDKALYEKKRPEIESILGCSGLYDYSLSTGGDKYASYYVWRDKLEGEELILAFDQDSKFLGYQPPIDLTEKPKTSTCNPVYSQWKDIAKRDSLAELEKKMGCSGVNRGEDEKDESVKDWGKLDLSTPRIIVALDKDKYVLAKSYYGKDATTCVPKDITSWQNIKLKSGYADVKQAMQCEGVLKEAHTEVEVDFSNPKNITSVYTWKTKLLSDESLDVFYNMYFAGDQLFNKTYSKPKFNTKCKPTQQNFNGLTLNESWNVLEKTMPCASELIYSQESADTKLRQYAWGSVDSKNVNTYLYAFVDKNNKLISKYIQFSPTN